MAILITDEGRVDLMHMCNEVTTKSKLQPSANDNITDSNDHYDNGYNNVVRLPQDNTTKAVTPVEIRCLQIWDHELQTFRLVEPDETF